MFKEFKEFAMRGNVVDMAVGIVIGAAFGTIVKSFVSDVLMPPIGLLMGGVDFSNLFAVIKEGAPAGPYAALADAQAAGAVTLNYGMFINTVISFLIVAIAVFMVDQGDELGPAQGGSAGSRAHDQGVRVLHHRDPDQGHPLPQLHFAAVRLTQLRRLIISSGQVVRSAISSTLPPKVFCRRPRRCRPRTRRSQSEARSTISPTTWSLK